MPKSTTTAQERARSKSRDQQAAYRTKEGGKASKSVPDRTVIDGSHGVGLRQLAERAANLKRMREVQMCKQAQETGYEREESRTSAFDIVKENQKI